MTSEIIITDKVRDTHIKIEGFDMDGELRICGNDLEMYVTEAGVVKMISFLTEQLEILKSSRS